jgi:maltose O-acetyltransferase
VADIPKLFTVEIKTMKNMVFEMVAELNNHLWRYRQRRRWKKLRGMGMHIGKGVNLPLSTWIDDSHCFLISIGDNCGFGEGCAILAHDAMPNEYIDATKIGRVVIHESCHFGTRAIILPGVKIGPRSIVGANSVVAKDIPPETVASGNPARVICTLDEYLNKHREWMSKMPTFSYDEYVRHFDSDKLREMNDKLARTSGYIVGGYSAMVESGECLYRTK